MTTVFILQDIVPSYRVPAFRKLAAQPGIDLTVFYSRPGRASSGENLQNSAQLEGFRAVELPLVEIGGSTWQPHIIVRLLRERPDVLIAGQGGRVDVLLALLLTRLLGIRFLWFLGGVHSRDPEQIRAQMSRGRLNRWFGRANPRELIARRADGLIVYSEHARSFYAGRGFDPRCIWVAPNSPDTEALELAARDWKAQPAMLAAERRRLAPADKPLLFLLGRLNAGRKVDTLLRALARLRATGIEAALVIVGDGAERPSLERMARDLGLTDVRFEGAIYDERELTRYFLLCDVFVSGLASLAVKMAMALGRPVVTGDYGLEVHDIEDGVNGYLVPLDDDAKLASRLGELIASPARRSAMGAAGARTIRERVNIARMIDAFRRAIDNRPAVSDAHSAGGGVHGGA